MTPAERETYRLHAGLRAFRRRCDVAREIIAAALAVARRPYVSLSCGKDSVVLADMVLHAAGPSVPLRFLSSGETRLLHDVDTVLDYFRGRGAPVEEINIDRVFAPEWRAVSWADSRRAGDDDLQRFGAGYDAAFLGLRAQESPQRRMSLYGCRTPGLPQFVYRMATGILRVCPLAIWRTEDVGAYIVTRDLPVLRAYRDGLEARTTARLTKTAAKMGALSRLRSRDPDAYFRMVERWPELRSIETQYD